MTTCCPWRPQVAARWRQALFPQAESSLSQAKNSRRWGRSRSVRTWGQVLPFLHALICQAWSPHLGDQVGQALSQRSYVALFGFAPMCYKNSCFAVRLCCHSHRHNHHNQCISWKTPENSCRGEAYSLAPPSPLLSFGSMWPGSGSISNGMAASLAYHHPSDTGEGVKG